jgi:hypothetical protein
MKYTITLASFYWSWVSYLALSYLLEQQSVEVEKNMAWILCGVYFFRLNWRIGAIELPFEKMKYPCEFFYHQQ